MPNLNPYRNWIGILDNKHSVHWAINSPPPKKTPPSLFLAKPLPHPYIGNLSKPSYFRQFSSPFILIFREPSS